MNYVGFLVKGVREMLEGMWEGCGEVYKGMVLVGDKLDVIVIEQVQNFFPCVQA